MSINKKYFLIILICLLIILIIGVGIFFANKNDEEMANVNNTIQEPEIIDETPPIIILGDSYPVKKGYEKELVNVIFSADDIDPNPKREIIGEYDINTPGEYPLTYKIEDKSGNITTKDFILKVRENDVQYEEEDIDFKDAIKKYKTASTKLGIDVSKWQEEIDWAKVKNEGVEFAILRMGYQNGFDGEVLVDPYFAENLDGCKKNNIPVGIYFSSYAKSAEESKKHADWIYENIKGLNLDNLTIAFDWENWNSFNTLGISLNGINNIANVFMEECENLGYKAMLYGSKTYLNEVWQNPNNYPVWLANYVSETSYEKPYKLWQFCQTGHIAGISGAVDINVMYLQNNQNN